MKVAFDKRKCLQYFVYGGHLFAEYCSIEAFDGLLMPCLEVKMIHHDTSKPLILQVLARVLSEGRK